MTVCEILAEPLGRLGRMRELERFSSDADLRAAREEMATWYRPGELPASPPTWLHSPLADIAAISRYLVDAWELSR
jgi:hypothetical protein